MGQFKDIQSGRFQLREEIESDYFEWLCNYVGATYLQDDYVFLLKNIHAIPFKWEDVLDANRCADGMELRIGYSNDSGYFARHNLTGHCTMLEVIIGIAERMEGLTEGYSVPHFFWEMLGNLELLEFTDENFYMFSGIVVVEDVMRTLCDRTFQRNGSGGLFPLAHSRKDQRIRDIWYQMNVYLMENYHDFDDLI